MSSSEKSFSVICSVLGLSLAVFIASLDSSITNTALPQISQALHIVFTDAIWIVNSYQLVMVALILPLAALADQVGHKKIFLNGLVIFIVASWCCGLASSIDQLIFARALQGVGAAAILGTNIALVRLIYTAKNLGVGLGINALIVALGLAGGPMIASVILSKLTWHWLFFINIPVGVLALVAAYALPISKRQKNQAFNFISALLSMVMFASIIYALAAFALSGSVLLFCLCMGLGALSAVVLYIRETKQNYVIFPFDLFQHSIFSLSILTAFLAFIVQGLMLIAVPYILFRSGYSVAKIGFLIAPWPVMGAIMAPVAGILSNRISSAYLGATGLVILSGAIAVLIYFQANLTHGLIMLCMACCGIGFGVFLTPNQRMLMASSPIQRSGVAGGMLNIARTTGQAVGAALVAVSIQFTEKSDSMMLWLAALLALSAAIVSFYRKFNLENDQE